MADQWPSLGWVDWLQAGVLLISMVVGVVRGFVFEVLSLAGWLVAWFAAWWLLPQVLAAWPGALAGWPAREAVAFVLCFLVVLVVWALLARLVRMLVHATPLTVPDRILGAGFGLVRGGVLLLAMATVVLWTPASQSAAWRQSHGARWLEAALRGLEPLVPAGIVKR